MENLGQTKVIYVPINTEVRGSFHAVQKTKLPKTASPCIQDPAYSFTVCMEKYVSNTAGCRLDWVGTEDEDASREQTTCSTWGQVEGEDVVNLFVILTLKSVSG